jgi:hypothetical protein
MFFFLLGFGFFYFNFFHFFAFFLFLGLCVYVQFFLFKFVQDFFHDVYVFIHSFSAFEELKSSVHLFFHFESETVGLFHSEIIDSGSQRALVSQISRNFSFVLKN